MTIWPWWPKGTSIPGGSKPPNASAKTNDHLEASASVPCSLLLQGHWSATVWTRWTAGLNQLGTFFVLFSAALLVNCFGKDMNATVPAGHKIFLSLMYTGSHDYIEMRWVSCCSPVWITVFPLSLSLFCLQETQDETAVLWLDEIQGGIHQSNRDTEEAQQCKSVLQSSTAWGLGSFVYVCFWLKVSWMPGLIWKWSRC